VEITNGKYNEQKPIKSVNTTIRTATCTIIGTELSTKLIKYKEVNSIAAEIDTALSVESIFFSIGMSILMKQLF
jgi:hypothetical protein